MIVLIYILIILVFLCGAFLFAGSEMALITLNKHRVMKKAKKGDKKNIALQKIIDDPVRMINTLLIGTNLCIISGSILSNALFKITTIKNPAIWALFITSFLYLIIGELIPKTLFRYAPNKMALKILPFLKISFFIFHPIEKIFSALVTKTIKKNPETNNKRISKKDFIDLLELASNEGSFQKIEKELILKTFEFSRSSIKDIMVPIEKVVIIDQSDTVEKAIDLFKKSRHSRILVRKEGTQNNISGILTIFDILYSNEEINEISSVIRPASRIKENLTCERAFQFILTKKSPLLIVYSSEGTERCTGIVTISDLINNLFGDNVF
ncbi:MAG: DUF21 domain-containing protein [Candidatus Aureabacteria bacterium]|nr:DUF21 domain-containing protein [Candidatus Auribacterota bacterium]